MSQLTDQAQVRRTLQQLAGEASHGMAIQPGAPDSWLPSHLPPAAAGLFRLRRPRADRCHPRHVDQRAADPDTGGTGRHWRLAQLAVDRENGIRPARRQRSDLRLAAPLLHLDRRRLYCLRDAYTGGRSGWMDRAQTGRPPLHSRSDADRGRDRDPGCRCRRDVDRGRFSPRRGRAMLARKTSFAPSWAWYRFWDASRWAWNPFCGRAIRLARQHPRP